MVPNELGICPKIDIDSALKSPEFKVYQIAAAELEKVSLQSLSTPQLYAFYLNVYQCMYIHYFFRAVLITKKCLAEIKGQSLF